MSRNYFLHYLNRAFAACLAVFIFAIPLSALSATQEDLQFAIDQKAKQLDEVAKQLQSTQIQLLDVAAQGKTLKQEVSRIDDNVKKVNLGIQVSQLTVDKLGLEIESISGQITQSEQSILLKQGAVATLLREYQDRSDEGLLFLFLSDKTLSEVLAETQSIQDFNVGLLEQVNQLRQLKSQLSGQLNQQSDKKQSAQREAETLKARKAIAEDQLADKQKLLADTKKSEANYQKIVDELQKQQQQISDDIADIEQQLRDKYGTSNLPLKRPGVFSKPIASGTMTQGYGKTPDACRLYKKTCFHNGIDFGIPIGTPVLAADDGTVFAAGNNGKLQYGRYIVLKHDNGLATLYGHLSRQQVKTGDLVKRGDIIGYSGKTGYAFGAHLHFGVYLGSTVKLTAIAGAGLVPIGLTLNPLDYL